MAKRVYRLKWRTKILIFLSIFSYFVIVFFQQEIRMSDQKVETEQLRQEISQVQYENDMLSRQIYHTRSNEYIERAARDKLGWVKDGETIYIEKEK